MAPSPDTIRSSARGFAVATPRLRGLLTALGLVSLIGVGFAAETTIQHVAGSAESPIHVTGPQTSPVLAEDAPMQPAGSEEVVRDLLSRLDVLVTRAGALLESIPQPLEAEPEPPQGMSAARSGGARILEVTSR